MFRTVLTVTLVSVTRTVVEMGTRKMVAWLAAVVAVATVDSVLQKRTWRKQCLMWSSQVCGCVCSVVTRYTHSVSCVE